MEILKSRTFGFIVIMIVYTMATACGVICYLYLPLDFRLNLLIADIIATVITFIFSVLFRNASVYDPYWSVQPIVIVIAYAIEAPILGAAQILPMIAIFIWGVRLTANWAYTFHGLEHQDWRYTMLHQTTGKFYPLVNFLGIHLVPTLIVYGCTLPAVFTLVYTPSFNAGSAVFFALSICAVILQGTADCQMHAFRKRKTGGFIRNGLWKYSRHPNYLGEITMWWGVALAFVCIMPEYWYLIAGAFANTLLFLFISIPLADKRQSRKDGFADYKAATRMLLPIKKQSN
ncbi:MAG: DUF1295 domain-containing protein [Clostridiales bacterium]|nr:DUF1295 domain-containing protein [Clostridiales bacterium]